MNMIIYLIITALVFFLCGTLYGYYRADMKYSRLLDRYADIAKSMPELFDSRKQSEE